MIPEKNHNNKCGDLPLKLAFIGGAFDSAVGNTHRIAVSMDNKFELVAGVFSRDIHKNKLTAKKYNISPERSYANIEELIKFEKNAIDAIVIMTPQDQHFHYIMNCIDENIPVICEKALVPDVNSALEIKQKLEEKKAYLSVTYNYTGYPMIREMRNMINSGFFGVVQQIFLEMPQEGFGKLNENKEPIVPQKWRLHDDYIPTVSLDLGIHLHLMGFFLSGKKACAVNAVSSTYGNFGHIIDNVITMVRYEDNVIGNLWYSKVAMGYRNGLRVRILCSKGTLEWIQEKPEYLYVSDNQGNQYRVDRGSPNLKVASQERYQRFKVGHPAGFIEAFSNYYYDIASDLNNYQKGTHDVNEYVFGIDSSVEGLNFLHAIARSSKSNSWENVGV